MLKSDEWRPTFFYSDVPGAYTLLSKIKLFINSNTGLHWNQLSLLSKDGMNIIAFI